MEKQAIEHLYAHVPFCPRICPYCAFYVERAEAKFNAPFVDALLHEWATRRRQHPVKPRTIFVGGGTPSALPTRELERLLTGLAEAGRPEEWTVEINPTTVSAEKARMMREAGVTRASLGAQSFKRETLQVLGRQHTPERIRQSYDLLRSAGFGSVNIDLIFAVPGQSLDDWEETLRLTCELNPDHVSAYCLTYEEDTPFFERLTQGEWTVDTDHEAEFYRVTVRLLAEAGLQRYEVSNFARPGLECQHNLAIWRGADYLGLGPSGVSRVGRRRWKNRSDLVSYLQSSVTDVWLEEEREDIDAELARRERLIFGLRTVAGVREAGFDREFEQLEREGYAERVGRGWRLTEEGLLRADAIGEIFLP